MTKAAVNRKKVFLYLYFLKSNCPIPGFFREAIEICRFILMSLLARAGSLTFPP